MKIFNRLDYDPFTVYVDSFVYPKSSNTHQHEDILGYVLYVGNTPTLVDAGRPSYADRSKFLDASYHNGFADKHRPIRPIPRFFFSNALLNQTDLSSEIQPLHSHFVARNKVLKVSKSLDFIYEDKPKLKVSETLESISAIDARLYHIFPDEQVEKVSNNIIYHHSSKCRFVYDNVETVNVEPFSCAIGYGKTVPSIRAIITSNYASQSITWSVTHEA